MSDFYEFSCGCKIPINGDKDVLKSYDNLPSMTIPYEEISRQLNYGVSCPDVWQLYHKGYTKGIFQLETQLGQNWSEKFKPSSLQEICALISAIRPGVLRAFLDGKNMAQHYSDRKHGKSEITYPVNELKEFLDVTYGVLLYQEQAMRAAVGLAGFTEVQADNLRKAIGTKDSALMAKVKIEFIEGVKKTNRITEDEGFIVFDWIEKSQRYSFNASHGIGYGSIGYLTAFVKHHYPLHFFCAWLRFARNKADTRQEIQDLISDTKLFGIDVLPPQIETLNVLGGDICIDKNHLNFGIKCVKHMGDSAVNEFMENFKKVELSLGRPIKKWRWIEFLLLVAPNVKKTSINTLISIGLLDFFGKTRNEMLYETKMVSTLSQREIDGCKQYIKNFDDIGELFKYYVTTDKKVGGPANKNRVVKINDNVKFLKDPPFSLKDTPKWVLMQEKELLGTPITYSILDTINSKYIINTTCKEFTEGKGGELTLACEITDVREYTITNGSNKGNKMGFLTLEDRTGSISSVCFTNVWVENKDILYKGNLAIFIGSKSNKNSLQITKIIEI